MENIFNKKYRKKEATYQKFIQMINLSFKFDRNSVEYAKISKCVWYLLDKWMGMEMDK